MAAMWIVAVLAVATVWGVPLDGPLDPTDFMDYTPLNISSTDETVAPNNSTTAPSNTTGSVKSTSVSSTTSLTTIQVNVTTDFVNSTTVSLNVTDVATNGTTASPPRPTTPADSTVGFNVTESPIVENDNATMTVELENTTDNSNSTEDCVETERPTTEIVSVESDLTEDGNSTESATVESATVEGNFTVSEGVDEENATVTLDPMEVGNFSDVTVEASTVESGSENATVAGAEVVSTTGAVNGTETATTEGWFDEYVSEEEEMTTEASTLPHLRWVHAPKTTTQEPDDSFKVDSPTIVAGKNLRICTWNVFRFGPTKFKEPDEFLSRYSRRKLHMMVEQVSNCDMLALQEYFDPSLEVLKRFARALSKNTGSTWNFTVSERVGRTSQEQYVFLFRSELAQAVDQDICPDPDDVYSREPFFTKFKILKKGSCFSEIVMGTIHTEPDRAVEEMNELVKSYDWAEKRFNTKNVMVLGDYNADCQYVRKSAWPQVELLTDKRFKWFIPTGTDTASMTSECTFDRAVVREEKLAKCFVDMKVLDFVQKYKIKVSEARQLSDHFPVVLNFN